MYRSSDSLLISNNLHLAIVVISLLALTVGCGGDSGVDDPVYSGSSIYQEERDGQTSIIYQISISDGEGNPYTGGLLVVGAAFTPITSFPIAAANEDGHAKIVLTATSPGKYSIVIDGLTDTKGETFTPSPGDDNVNGKVLLSHNYAP